MSAGEGRLCSRCAPTTSDRSVSWAEASRPSQGGIRRARGPPVPGDPPGDPGGRQAHFELGYPPEQWARMMENLERMGKAEGIVFSERTFTTNSHKALLLAEAAKKEGPGSSRRSTKGCSAPTSPRGGISGTRRFSGTWRRQQVSPTAGSGSPGPTRLTKNGCDAITRRRRRSASRGCPLHHRRSLDPRRRRPGRDAARSGDKGLGREVLTGMDVFDFCI